MPTILDEIVATKRREIAEARLRVPSGELERQLAHAPPPRDFRARLEASLRVAIIAEIKRASPSAGLIRQDFDPVAIARIYEANAASCISVLTDAPYFQGSLDYLRDVRRTVQLPVLRKDFILDPYQLLEARCAGADAILLIAEILDDVSLRTLLEDTHRLGMQALVELYDADNVPRVVKAGAKLIGINNRDLRTFVTRLEHTLDLARQIPRDCCLVSESGISTYQDLQRLEAAGVRAVLVGESLMRSSDIGAQLRKLLGSESH
jgi:indole-3-glycerol phosphate synthase